MDSIEKMRRINDLTKELKSHGFADSSFEAIKQANQIYGDDAVEENVKQGIIQKSVHERIAGNDGVDDGASYSDRKLSSISASVDILTNKMNEIIKAINDIDSRLNELKARQDRLTTQRQEVHEEQKLVSAQERPAPASVPREQSKTDEYAMNQRTGNYASEDVAIDKMFYFGKK